MIMRVHFRVWVILMIGYLALFYYTNAQEERSIFDKYAPMLRIFRQSYLNLFGRTSQDSRNLKEARSKHKFQKRISKNSPFPCSTVGFRSEKRPKDVHSLRPGDIDVIGAMGDSLTAANGLAATNIFHVLIENRGISWSIGGQGSWREYITLPNILKMFNPNLIGFSLGDSSSSQRAAQFNVGEAGSISQNMPYMSKVLVRRITQDPRVNVKEHWKMITLLIGPNDFCLEICYHSPPEKVLDLHRRDLMKVLRTLRDNLPRTIVNLVPPPNLKVLSSFTNKPLFCHITHSAECPCIFGLTYKNLQNRFQKLMTRWQEVDMEVANAPEFEREDFAVVIQPFLTSYKFPNDSAGYTDYTLLSEDCFHLSQKGNALVANGVWNNMLEPVGRKSIAGATMLFQPLLCPSESKPFLFTKRNSGN